MKAWERAGTVTMRDYWDCDSFLIPAGSFMAGDLWVDLSSMFPFQSLLFLLKPGYVDCGDLA